MSSLTSKQSRQLEDLFFAKRDAVLVEKQKQLQKMEHTRQALSKVSGITNPGVLHKLMDLNVSPEVLASIAVVPLIEVAWADGKVHDSERQAILQGAADVGWGKGSIDYVLIDEWLKHRPPAKLLRAWVHCVEEICASLPDKEREALKKSLLARATDVARAAGGLLGLTSPISWAERQMIRELDGAFE
jgi:hypothetical protein